MAPRTLGLYLAGSLFCYAAALGAGFVSDDFVFLEALRSGKSTLSWGAHQGGFLRPVTIASYWLDLRLHGGSPLWMHAENALIHGWCASLVHALAARLRAELGPGGAGLPLLAGLLFLVHPSHAEPVACVSGRGDVLSAALALLGVVLGVDYLKRGRGALLAGAAAAWTAAVFAKESALAAPGMFAALALLAFRGPRRRVLAVLGAGSLALCASFAARTLVFGGFIATAGGASRLDVSPAVAWSALKRQVWRTFVPALVPGDRATLAASILVLGLLGATLWILARRAAAMRARGGTLACVLGLGAAYLCSLVPALGSKVRIDTGEGERFVYLGTAMAMLAVAAVLSLRPPPRAARSIAGAWILAYALLLVPAVARWRTAGELAARIVTALVRDARGPEPLVLNLPDSVEGAYVFRNGLAQAVGERRDLDVTALATFTADRDGGGAEVAERAGHADAFELRFARRMPYDSVRSPGLVERLETGAETRLTTVALSSFSDLFAFRSGELVRVGPRDDRR